MVRMGLRLKLSLPLLIASLLLVGYIAASWMPRSLANLEAGYQRLTENLLDSVAEGLVPLLLAHQVDTVHGNLDALLRRNPDWVELRLVSPTGETLYPLGIPHPPPPEDRDVRLFSRSIVFLEEPLGTLSIKVDFDNPMMREMRQRHLWLLGICIAMMAIFVAAILLILHRTVIAPLETMAVASKRLAAGDYSVPLPAPRSDEVGTMIASFSSMRSAISEEIAKRRRAEEAVRTLNAALEERVALRTAELEAAVRDIESFSYSVSHDLRAPLRHIASFSQILQQDHAHQLDAEARDYLNRICRGAVRMGQLIDELLDLFRIGRAPLNRTQVDLSTMAREVVDELSEAHPERTVAVTIPSGIRGSADPFLVRVVLQNLLENAWKYTGRSPEAAIEFGATRQAGEPVYFVADNGTGFDMEYADKLFGPFQRLHSEAEFEGTGIGLATVRRIIERHGGRIWAESREGEGATFFFTLGENTSGMENT